jgi:hypothetical protein
MKFVEPIEPNRKFGAMGHPSRDRADVRRLGTAGNLPMRSKNVPTCSTRTTTEERASPILFNPCSAPATPTQIEGHPSRARADVRRLGIPGKNVPTCCTQKRTAEGLVQSEEKVGVELLLTIHCTLTRERASSESGYDTRRRSNSGLALATNLWRRVRETRPSFAKRKS